MERLFAPFGYEVHAEPIALDPAHSDWGVSPYVSPTIKGVARIRRVYVDQSSVIMAIGERIKRSSVNRAVNR